MAKSYEVLRMLIPNGGYVQYGEDYDGIKFVNCDPITEEQYKAGFAQYDAWYANEQKKAEAKKKEVVAKFAALGLTADELKVIGLA